MGRTALYAQWYSAERMPRRGAYLNSPTSEPGAHVIPYHEDLPKILDRVYACNEIVKIDYYIPGCPPDANHIWKALKNILWEKNIRSFTQIQIRLKLVL